MCQSVSLGCIKGVLVCVKVCHWDVSKGCVSVSLGFVRVTRECQGVSLGCV